MNNDSTTSGNTPNTNSGMTAKKGAIAAGACTVAALFLFAAFNFFGMDDQHDDRTTDQVASGIETGGADVAQSHRVDDLLIGDPEEDDLIGGDSGDDILVRDGGDDVILSGPDDDILDGGAGDDGLTTGPSSVAEEPRDPFLQELCVDISHVPVPDQDSATGIWVRGSLFGLSHDSWVWIGGPSINNGNPVQIPVGADGSFDGGLGINQYGDHELTRFEIWSGEPADQPVDLLPLLGQHLDSPTIPVGPDEGSPFDQDCFTFDEPTPDQAGSNPTELDSQAQEFLDAFVLDHANQDVTHLGMTLHPAVTLAFGQNTCVDYVQRTVGSITAVEVLDVAGPTPFELPTPDGPIGFPEVINVHAELTLSSGDVQVTDLHLPLHDGDAYWLTQCGVEMP